MATLRITSESDKGTREIGSINETPDGLVYHANPGLVHDRALREQLSQLLFQWVMKLAEYADDKGEKS